MTDKSDTGDWPRLRLPPKEDMPALRAVERALLPELSTPSRQAAQDYAQPVYRQSDSEIDPIIRALLTHLPPPGDVWPKEARKLWLDLLTGSFGMIYREPEVKTHTAEQ